MTDSRGGVQSMTGYGRATRRTTRALVSVEARSTNHRYLEVDARVPGALSGIQGRLAEVVRSHIRRGRVELTVGVQWTRRWSPRRVVLDDALLRRYHEALRSMQRRLKLRGPITLDHVLALPQAITVLEERPPSDIAWPAVRTAAAAAVRELARARRREGARLVADLRRQLAAIRRHLGRIQARLPSALRSQQAYVRSRLRELLGSSAAAGAPQLEEVVALVQSADVHEELVRLQSHLVHLRQTLAQGGLVGKALDFIAQELTREANTLGAKVNDPEAARHVVAVKGCIERIREQVQNLQ